MESANVRITQTSCTRDLEGIRALQLANLGRNISKEESDAEGFVTAEYSVEFLQLMHEAEPSIIAKDGDAVVGYALVATKEVCRQHPLLRDLLQSIEALSYCGTSLTNVPFVIVGQLCVAKDYRGKGLAWKMYEQYRTLLSGKYACAITEVAVSNERSMRAHLKSGFKTVTTAEYNGVNFNIVLFDWALTRA